MGDRAVVPLFIVFALPACVLMLHVWEMSSRQQLMIQDHCFLLHLITLLAVIEQTQWGTTLPCDLAAKASTCCLVDLGDLLLGVKCLAWRCSGLPLKVPAGENGGSSLFLIENEDSSADIFRTYISMTQRVLLYCCSFLFTLMHSDLLDFWILKGLGAFSCNHGRCFMGSRLDIVRVILFLWI